MKHIIALDVGGTKIDGILTNENYKVLRRFRTATEAASRKKSVLKNIIDVIEKLAANQKVFALGICIPGDVKNGKLGFIPNIPSLNNLDLAKFLKKKYKCKVALENDANCFAIAEHKFGAGKGATNMVGITLGTGVGGGLIIHNKIYHGSGGAGEIGHTIIDPYGLRCNCGQVGDFESWCSGPNIVRRYKKAGGRMKNPTPYKIWRSKELIAKKIVKETYEKLAVGFANLVNILNPELIVVGGGISNDIDYKYLAGRTKRHAYPSARKSIKIAKYKLTDATAIGAALIANS